MGYSPERINPGDKVHRLETIAKVVAGQDEATGELLQQVYGTVVKAGTHLAPNIRTAEAAKVIENTQRDLNIALMNELALIFEDDGHRHPGRARSRGHQMEFPAVQARPGGRPLHRRGPVLPDLQGPGPGAAPHVILAGREINDNMGKYIAEATIKRLIKNDCKIMGARVGVLGLTFKENVPDLRNTRVVDILAELDDYGVEILVHDAEADHEEAEQELGVSLCDLDEMRNLDALILAVPHAAYRDIAVSELKGWFADPARALVVDVKGFFDRAELEAEAVAYWRL